jgi:hypothetical protein
MGRNDESVQVDELSVSCAWSELLGHCSGDGIDYAGTVEKSGHSTIWLMVPFGPPAGFNNYWLSLERLHCTYESSSMDTTDGKQTLYSVDIPPETDIDAILSIIEEGQADDVWIFQIGDLAHKMATG